ncbi:hypothetical protein GGR57DRAFT_506607 [Xylariaceae sp. FL1272]|nr:hypothetical protein GGR57DRAFT_506607 [Xylariaceae sp. FL1272]
MSASLSASIPFEAPEVSEADIASFHASHFSPDAIASFGTHFLSVEAPAYEGTVEYYEEDDGLGYYPDGVKRTLTDDQIAIFRHSELEALRRADERSKNQTSDNRQTPVGPTSIDTPNTSHYDDSPKDEVMADEAGEGSEDGEIETEKPVLTKNELKRQKRQRARQKKKAADRKFVPEKKPDLRKRTWDVVEAGMDALYYDDVGNAQNQESTMTTTRKQISYDD